MPIGTITFFPSPTWAFNRSYLGGIVISRCGDHILSQDGNVFTIDITNPFPHYYKIIFLEQIMPWTSNSYTLDHCLTDVYFVIPPSPIQTPADGVLTLQSVINSDRYFLRFNIAGCALDPFEFPWEGAPDGWWSKPFG